MATLEIRDLHVTVEADNATKEILKGVDLTVKQGETHVIMGPNGSGNSTLAYALAGHPKYTVTSGTVTLDGEDVLAMSVDARAKPGHGVLLITHYNRILQYVQPDYVHVFVAGRIVEEGGAELAKVLENEGYE